MIQKTLHIIIFNQDHNEEIPESDLSAARKSIINARLARSIFREVVNGLIDAQGVNPEIPADLRVFLVGMQKKEDFERLPKDLRQRAEAIFAWMTTRPEE